jgi:hypothetical protein
LDETATRIDTSTDTAKQALKEIKATLDRWDGMKAKFSAALDGAIHRIADAMRDENVTAPAGPPSGITAHGSLLEGEVLADPRCIVECAAVARPTMAAKIPAHEYADEPQVLERKVAALADLIRRANGHLAVYTGAGISTVRKLPLTWLRVRPDRA